MSVDIEVRLITMQLFPNPVGKPAKPQQIRRPEHADAVITIQSLAGIQFPLNLGQKGVLKTKKGAGQARKTF